MLFASLLSDIHAILLQGNVIDCTAKATIAHNFHGLQKGVILSIEDFVVRYDKEEYRVKKNNTFMLEFNGKTRLRKSSVISDGYIRYPLQLLDIDNIEPTRNKSLIGKFVLVICN